MSPRLPIPGSDDDTWGDILNGYLEVSLNSDGTLANNTVGTNQLRNNAVTNAQLDSAIQAAVAKANSAVQTVNGHAGPAVTLGASDVSAIPTSQLGAPNGVATLDSTSRLTPSQIPLGVDTVNWCTFSVNPTTLTASSPNCSYLESDYTILDQSGTDFSIGTFQSNGAIFSAGGGRFQMALLLVSPTDATLDSGSTAQRWLTFNAILGTSLNGDPNAPINGFGLDGLIPVLLASVPNVFQVTSTVVSAPGYVQPGGPAYSAMGVELVGGFGTDSVPLDRAIVEGCIWQF